MKTKLTLAAALLALSFTAAAQTTAAAPPSGRDRPVLGIGIGIVPFAAPTVNPGSATTTISRTVEIYLPISVAPNFRLEPSLGIASDDQPGGGTDTRDVTFGLGALYVGRLAPAVDWYGGGRLKLNFAHVSNPAGSDSGTDVQVMGAFGGEYYLAPKFSLGLEANLGLFSNSNVSGDDDGWFTAGVAFLRLYFK